MKKIASIIRIILRPLFDLKFRDVVSLVGLVGLIDMIIRPENRDPMLAVVFFTMLGVGPLASLDRALGSDDKDDK